MPGKKKRITELSKTHKAEVTVTFAKEQSIQVLPPFPSPYNPDLGPSEFWLFPLIKGKLAQTTGTVCAKRRGVL